MAPTTGFRPLCLPPSQSASNHKNTSHVLRSVKISPTLLPAQLARSLAVLLATLAFTTAVSAQQGRMLPNDTVLLRATADTLVLIQPGNDGIFRVTSLLGEPLPADSPWQEGTQILKVANREPTTVSALRAQVEAADGKPLQFELLSKGRIIKLTHDLPLFGGSARMSSGNPNGPAAPLGAPAQQSSAVAAALPAGMNWNSDTASTDNMSIAGYLIDANSDGQPAVVSVTAHAANSAVALRYGDIILKVGQVAVKNVPGLQKQLELLDGEVALTVQRKTVRLIVSVPARARS